MVNQRQQTNKVVEKTEEPATELVPETLNETPAGLDEVLGRAEMAYTAYLEAQRKVAAAYKEQERQEDKEHIKKLERKLKRFIRKA